MGQILQPISLLEKLLYTTVRVLASNDSGKEWSGSGFFFQMKAADGNNIPFFITNKHVLAEATHARLVTHRMNDIEGPSGYYNGSDIDFNEGAIIYHPDPSVDLAAFSIAHTLDHWDSLGNPIFYQALTPDMIPLTEKEWAEFDAVEDLMMVGCPNGLYDTVNHFPVVRRGISATPIPIKYDGKEEFLADIACFGGSSGSPIFTLNLTHHFDRSTEKYQLGGRGMWLVGVLYAGPIYKQHGEVVLNTPIVELESPMHLGIAIRSSEIMTMLDNFLGKVGIARQLYRGQ